MATCMTARYDMIEGCESGGPDPGDDLFSWAVYDQSGVKVDVTQAVTQTVTAFVGPPDLAWPDPLTDPSVGYDYNDLIANGVHWLVLTTNGTELANQATPAASNPVQISLVQDAGQNVTTVEFLDAQGGSIVWQHTWTIQVDI